jgi:C4-dicarboxylate-specific signal transduction histidine kinase
MSRSPMSSNKPPVVHTFPRRALAAGIALTLALFITGGLGTWTLYQGMHSLATTELRLKGLTGEIIHLDEALTMSARMAASTGDLKWKERYKAFEPLLDAAIKKTIELAPEAYMSADAKQVDAVNAKLIEMENTGFRLVEEGQREAASGLLFSRAYEEQKAIYAAGMRRVNVNIEARAIRRVDEKRKLGLLSLGLAMAAVIGLAASWVVIIVLIRRFLRARDVAERALVSANATLESRVIERTETLTATNASLREEITRRELVERELRDQTAERERTEQMIAETRIRNARIAGMAEVATGVLHNVGNALNSVNVSVSLVSDRLRRSRLFSLGKATKLLRDNADHLSTFLTENPQGKQLPAYLEAVGSQLHRENEEIVREVEAMKKGIGHITAIVGAQQSFAKAGKGSTGTELATPESIFEESTSLALGTSTQHECEVTTDFAPVEAVPLDRHRLIEILVNFIRNAMQALQETPVGQRRLELSIHSDAQRLRFMVRDNGVGIAPEDKVKIFTHGFSTRAGGHGFGLHACACAAMEMGGTLGCESEGRGRGSTFFIDLPPVTRAEAA